MLSSGARWPRWAWTLAAMVALPAVAASCGSDDDPSGFLGGSGGGPPTLGPCVDGIVRDCSVKIAEQLGIVHCYLGTQTCSEGVWGACEGGDVVAKSQQGGIKPYSLSTVAACNPADPCDPSCMEWVEVPAPTYENLGLPQWSGGGDAVPAATNEPCIDAIDCQNDHRCVDPAPERQVAGRLVDDGLLVRYFLDEADTGTGVATVRDSAYSPLDLTASYPSGEMSWTGAAGGRGLSWTTVGLDGRASVAVDGTKIFNRLNGTQTATVELVMDIDAVTSNFSRFSHIGNGADIGVLTLSSSSSGTMLARWENAGVGSWAVDMPALGRIVVHLAIDTTPAATADRVRLYIDGTLQAGNINAPPTNDTLQVGAGTHYVIGNRELGDRSPQGSIYYAAMYDTALDATQVAQNVRILQGLDDAYVEHPKCEPGGPLYASSDRCVEDVCAANPGCCTRNNDCHTLYGGQADVLTPGVCDETSDTCFMAAQTNAGTTCAQICASGGGTCVEMYDNRSDTDLCGLLSGSAAGCNSNTFARGICVCAKPAAGAWDATCVQAVHDECGGYCETTGESGKCLEWGPGETDPDCAGWDITLQTGCAGTVVACNRGNSDIPAGQVIAHFDGATDQFASPNPGGVPYEQCTTTSLIQPGQCIDVACSNLASTMDEREVAANVPLTGQNAECHNGAYLNNWALHDDTVMCASPQLCDLEIALESGLCTYALANQAVLEPMGAYSISYDNGQGTTAMTDVGVVGGCTPTGVDEYYTDDPNQPTQITLCTNTCAAITTQRDRCQGASEHHDATNDRCYYYPAATATWANGRVACRAWGGDLAVITTQPEQTYVSGLVVAAAANTFVGGYEVLDNTSRWRWVTDEPWDYVWWAASEPNDSGGNEDYVQIQAAGLWNDISGGNATRYMCERHQPIAKKLSFSGTCDFISVVQTSETYTATCPAGQHAVWGLLAWDTVTPQDASVVWEVRTADSVPELAGAFVPAGTSTSTPTDNQVCAMTSQNPPAGFPPGPTTCPVDLFEALGGVPEATRDVLELRITLNPGTFVGAQVNQWQVRHSCVDAE